MVTDTSIIPALSKLRQRDGYKLEASLDIKQNKTKKQQPLFPVFRFDEISQPPALACCLAFPLGKEAFHPLAGQAGVKRRKGLGPWGH